MGTQIRMGKGNFKRERTAHCKVLGSSAVSCAKTAEPTEMPFRTGSQVDPRKHGIRWGVHLHHLLNAITVKLLSPLVFSYDCSYSYLLFVNYFAISVTVN